MTRPAPEPFTPMSQERKAVEEELAQLEAVWRPRNRWFWGGGVLLLLLISAGAGEPAVFLVGLILSPFLWLWLAAVSQRSRIVQLRRAQLSERLKDYAADAVRRGMRAIDRR